MARLSYSLPRFQGYHIGPGAAAVAGIQQYILKTGGLKGNALQAHFSNSTLNLKSPSLTLQATRPGSIYRDVRSSHGLVLVNSPGSPSLLAGTDPVQGIGLQSEAQPSTSGGIKAALGTAPE